MSVYKCSECNLTSKVKGNIKRHIITMCKEAKLIEDVVKVKCEICNKEYNTEFLLKQHKKVCFVKKAVLVTDYIGKEEIDLTIKNMMALIEDNKNMINLLIKENRISNDTNKELLKRVEKLEAKKIKESKELKEINGEEEEIYCSIFKKIEFVPVSRKHLRDTLRKYNVTEFMTAQLTIEGQRSNVICGQIEDKEYIDVEGTKYYYDFSKRVKGKKYADSIKIIVYKICENYAYCEMDEKYYCSEHYKELD